MRSIINFTANRAILNFVLLAVSLSLLLPSCFVNSSLVQAIQCTSQYPVNQYEEGGEIKIHYIRDTIALFYINEYILYRLPAVVDFKTGQNVTGTEPFFVYKRGANRGRLYTSLNDSSKGSRINIDTFILQNVRKIKDVDTPPDSLWSLTEEREIDNEDLRVEKFSLIKKSNELLFDSVLFYYSRSMRNIEFSLSPKLDKEKKSKLCQVFLVYNEGYSPSQKRNLPKHEFRFGIERILPGKTDYLRELIEKSKRDEVIE
jgi:hypothetical protein